MLDLSLNCCDLSKGFNIFFASMERAVSFDEGNEDDAETTLNIGKVSIPKAFNLRSRFRFPTAFLFSHGCTIRGTLMRSLEESIPEMRMLRLNKRIMIQ